MYDAVDLSPITFSKSASDLELMSSSRSVYSTGKSIIIKYHSSTAAHRMSSSLLQLKIEKV